MVLVVTLLVFDVFSGNSYVEAIVEIQLCFVWLWSKWWCDAQIDRTGSHAHPRCTAPSFHRLENSTATSASPFKKFQPPFFLWRFCCCKSVLLQFLPGFLRLPNMWMFESKFQVEPLWSVTYIYESCGRFSSAGSCCRVSMWKFVNPHPSQIPSGKLT